MNLIRFLFQVLLHLGKTITYHWVVDLAGIVKRFLKSLHALCAFVKKPHPIREGSEKDCVVVNNPSLHRPDPCIYSQEYLLKLGLAVTWDNPDIVVLQGGVPVPENALLPDTEYEIDATVWNNSYDAPVVGLPVRFSYLTFGVATVSTAIGETFVNLGVKGSANQPAVAKMMWKTPPVPGHYCLQVNLDWIDDANPGNNMGQNNLDVVAPHSAATFNFPLRNNSGKENRFTFEVDTYTIPQLPECGTQIAPEDRGTRGERLRRIKARHNKSDYPVPPGWNVEIVPPDVSLAPDDETDIEVRITPPGGFAGEKRFNVNARYGEHYAGGVSLIVSTT